MEQDAQPVIILVEPQLGENIGMAARAMANFGLQRLRLVNPRDGWPSASAIAAASRAHHVIDNVQLFDTLSDAVADLNFVYATTARTREMAKPVRGPEEAAASLAQRTSQSFRTGILFGRERWGLNNDEIALSNEIITFPVDPDFSSLNIAQSVLLLSYAYRRARHAAEDFGDAVDDPAPWADQERLFEHLEAALDAVEYFRPAEKRPSMQRNLRVMLTRAGFTEGEVRTLRGVIAALEGRRTRPRKEEE